MDLTFEDLEEAVRSQQGPAFDWLGRVHVARGDALLRSLALDVARNVKSVHGDFPPELLEVFAAWLVDPVNHADAMRPWLASDAFVWREFAKLAYEWGGAVRSRARGGRPKVASELRALIRNVAHRHLHWCVSEDPP